MGNVFGLVKWNSVLWMKTLIIHHYSSTQYIRSNAHLERERYLIGKNVPFNRYVLMPCAMLSQTCLGSFFAWSGFNLPIEAQLYGRNCGVDRAVVVNVFYCAVVFITCSAAVAGPWLERVGPTKGLLVGASLFYFGNLLTALGVYVHQLPVIYVGYAVIGAIGQGIGILCPISPLQRWFPERRGVAAASAVCGFAMGGIISPYTQRALIGPLFHKTGEVNLGIELTFVILGSCYFVTMVLCAFVMRQPPPGYVVQGIGSETIKGAERKAEVLVGSDLPWAHRLRMKLSSSTSSSSVSAMLPNSSSRTELDNEPAPKSVEPTASISLAPAMDYSAHFAMTPMEALSSLQYWMIYVTFLGAELSGLLIFSKIQSIVQTQLGRSSSDGASANCLLGALDLLGRLILPFLSDLIKSRKPFYILSLVCQIVCLGCLPSALDARSYGGVLACTGTIIFFFENITQEDGGGFAMMAAFLADQFGAKNVGALQGVMMTSLAIVAIVGGLTFTAVYKAQKVVYSEDAVRWYDLNFRWMLGPVLLVLIVCLLTPTDIRVRHLPKSAGELYKIRAPNGRLLRVVRWRIIVVSASQEEAEWDTYLRTLAPKIAVIPC